MHSFLCLGFLPEIYFCVGRPKLFPIFCLASNCQANASFNFFFSGKTYSLNELKKINSSDKIFVFADKTRNIYETSLDTYNKLLHDNITKTYKHGSEDNISEINNELKHIADKLSIGNRIECMKKREAFISLKDHKENFENNPKCRLINPAKSDSGKISQLILDKVNRLKS